MAKATFHNLSDEKKKNILGALKAEFETHALNEASVAHIIKIADIPRGSFYQYFEDLEDSFFTVLESEISESHEIFAGVLKEKKGNLHEALESFGPAMADELFSKYKIYRMRYLNWNLTMAEKWREFRKSMRSSKNSDTGNENSFPSHFYTGVSSEQMGYMNTVIHSIIEKMFVMNWDREEFLKQYTQYMEWMINGLNLKNKY